MTNTKRLGWTVILTLLSAVSLPGSSDASMISGSFRGYADVDINNYTILPNGQQTGSTISAQNVPATFNFYLNDYNGGNPPPGAGVASIYIDNKVFPIGYTGDSGDSPIFPIFDGIPGKSGDYAHGEVDDVFNGLFPAASFTLTDPTGQYIGPNGNGDPSHVTISADISIRQINESETGTSTIGGVSFSTLSVPEPWSIVEAASGALVILVYAWRRRGLVTI
jgi:hypothetical protein